MCIPSERGQAKKAALRRDSILLENLPLEKSARLAVKGQYERRFRQSLFKSGNPGRSIHVSVIFFSRMCDLICRLHPSK